MTSISVVIPTYNGALYLREAIQSVLAQTVQPQEIIVSDSGSTDATMNVVKEETRGATCLVRVLDKRTPGMVENWNAAASAATSDFIKFVFQDDLLEARCLEKFVRAAEADSRIGFVWSDRRLIVEQSASGNSLARWHLNHQTLDREALSLAQMPRQGAALLSTRRLLDGVVNKIGEPSLVMMKRSLFEDLGGFNECGMIQIVDAEMWYRAFARTIVTYIPERLAVFRIHRQQVSLKNLDSKADGGDWLELIQSLGQPGVYKHLHVSVRRVVRECLAASGSNKVPPRKLFDYCFEALRWARRASQFSSTT